MSEDRILAADLFHGNVLVTFADGTTALIEAAALRNCAEQIDCFLAADTEEGDFGKPVED